MDKSIIAMSPIDLRFLSMQTCQSIAAITEEADDAIARGAIDHARDLLYGAKTLAEYYADKMEGA